MLQFKWNDNSEKTLEGSDGLTLIAKTEEDFNGLKEIGKICGAIRDELV